MSLDYVRALTFPLSGQGDEIWREPGLRTRLYFFSLSACVKPLQSSSGRSRLTPYFVPLSGQGNCKGAYVIQAHAIFPRRAGIQFRRGSGRVRGAGAEFGPLVQCAESGRSIRVGFARSPGAPTQLSRGLHGRFGCLAVVLSGGYLFYFFL